MPDPVHFWSIEYVDDDGDNRVEHGWLTQAEAGKLLDLFAQNGISVSMNRLSPDPPGSSAVSLPDGEKGLLGAPAEGHDG